MEKYPHQRSVNPNDAEHRVNKKTYLQTESEVMDAAIAILARRDYSAVELQRKLAEKTQEPALIAPILVRLQALGYQDDQRYTECYIRYGVSQGKGEAWIKLKLRQKGLAPALIESCFASADVPWHQVASEQLQRKFKIPAADPKEKAQQYRYLASRGFTPDVISYAIERLGSNEGEWLD